MLPLSKLAKVDPEPLGNNVCLLPSQAFAGPVLVANHASDNCFMDVSEARLSFEERKQKRTMSIFPSSNLGQWFPSINSFWKVSLYPLAKPSGFPWGQSLDFTFKSCHVRKRFFHTGAPRFWSACSASSSSLALAKITFIESWECLIAILDISKTQIGTSSTFRIRGNAACWRLLRSTFRHANCWK